MGIHDRVGSAVGGGAVASALILLSQRGLGGIGGALPTTKCFTLSTADDSSDYCTRLDSITNNGDGTATVNVTLLDRVDHGTGAITNPTLSIQIAGTVQHNATHGWTGSQVSASGQATQGDAVTVTATSSDFDGGSVTISGTVPAP